MIVGWAVLLCALFATTWPLTNLHVAVQIVVRLLLIGASGALTLVLLARGLIRNESLSPTAKNIGFTCATVFLLFLGLEAAFTLFPRSHAFGNSLAARRWDQYYWKPLNEYQYRDKPVPADLQTRDPIYVIGDSFTAGYGIVETRDRFSDVLASLLPEQSAVVNLGIRGSDVRSAVERLAVAAVPPRVVVYQYFGNDIEPVAVEMGRRYRYAPYEGLPKIARYLVENSYLLNFVYWYLPRGLNEDYGGHLESLYADAEIMAAHRRDLQKLADLVHQQSAQLVVVIFPFMHAPEESRFFVDPVSRFFSEQGIPVLDVSSLVGDLDPKARIVNSNDAHASVEVHHRVGQALFELLTGSRPH